MDYEFLENSDALEHRFFEELHQILQGHKHLDESISWWGDSISLDGTYSAKELRDVATLIDKYRDNYLQLRNEME